MTGLLRVSIWLTLASLLSASAVDDTQFIANAAETANQSLLWGTYRPNLYFGTRPRLPDSLMSGLMWFNGDTLKGLERVRHECTQGDGVTKYGYHKHDGRQYAAQHLHDDNNNVIITTEFIKAPGDRGGDWGVRVRGTLVKQQAQSITNVVFYFGLEGEGSMDVVSKLSDKGLESPIKLEGDTPGLGDFEIEIADGPIRKAPIPCNECDLSRTQWWGTNVDEGRIWEAKDIILKRIINRANTQAEHVSQREMYAKPHNYVRLPNEITEEEGHIANLYAFQKVFRGDFQFDVIYRAHESGKLTSETMTHELLSLENAFDTRFENTFHLEKKGFGEEEITFAKFLLSNLLGGIGYFHGDSVIDRSHAHGGDEAFTTRPNNPTFESASSLFTATPSRPFFPRGFYWDEGFHQLLIGKWDNDLSLDIIKSWVDLMDTDGWIAREQILGPEARSKVPIDFQTQFTDYANPPTLYLAIKRYVDRLQQHHRNGEEAAFKAQTVMTMTSMDDPAVQANLHLDQPVLAQHWLESVYPRLRNNWQWLRRTQRGELSRFGRQAPTDEAYRWRGRTPQHTFTSGFDDFPRAEPPHMGELHADLMAWMAYATRMLRDIASHLGDAYAADMSEYDAVYGAMITNLDALHWNEEEHMYCDQTVDGSGQTSPVCHKGYPALLPMVLGLLEPDSPRLGAILDMIANPDELWSDHGLRSLSASDDLFGSGENYWRGAIWININYLTLQSLHNNYIHVNGPFQAKAQTIYTQLRTNIISTVFKSYQQTGQVWEQYSEDTGEGRRSRPFTGWSSLVLLIMAEEYQ